jgi:hypothetical protein
VGARMLLRDEIQDQSNPLSATRSPGSSNVGVRPTAARFFCASSSVGPSVAVSPGRPDRGIRQRKAWRQQTVKVEHVHVYQGVQAIVRAMSNRKVEEGEAMKRKTNLRNE